MSSSRILLAALVLPLATQIPIASSQHNPFVEFSVSGTFLNRPNNEPAATLSGWFIVNQNNGMVVRADFYHGNTELPILSNAKKESTDVFRLNATNTAGDYLNLLLVAPQNDGSLAGYAGGALCNGVHPSCLLDSSHPEYGDVGSNFNVLYGGYSTNDDLYSGSVWRSGRAPIVRIALKPHGDGPAPINPRSHSLATIAIVSSREFDAVTDVDTHFLTFGPTGAEQSITSCDKDGRDVNNDGVPDLICHFNPRLTQFLPSESLGILIGKTTQGSPFVGTEKVMIRPVGE